MTSHTPDTEEVEFHYAGSALDSIDRSKAFYRWLDLVERDVRAAAAQRRVITNPGGLHDLPEQSVVIDNDGVAWQKQQRHWCMADDFPQYRQTFADHAPFTVIYTPA